MEYKKAGKQAGRPILFCIWVSYFQMMGVDLTFLLLLKKQTLKVKLLSGFGCRFQTRAETRDVVSMVNYEQMPAVCLLFLQAPQPDLIFSLELLRQDNFDNFIYLNTYTPSLIFQPFFSTFCSLNIPSSDFRNRHSTNFP